MSHNSFFGEAVNFKAGGSRLTTDYGTPMDDGKQLSKKCKVSNLCEARDKEIYIERVRRKI